ncbi:hypothetical protein EC968_009231 [Mortierella alpina]|nr:hypothetical protein EC968_009231 [Mortierella alpina]
MSSSSRAPLDRKRPLTSSTQTASVAATPATERPRWVGAWSSSTSSPTSTSTSTSTASPSTCKITTAPCPSASTRAGQQQQQRRQSFSSRSSMADHGVDTRERNSRHVRRSLEDPLSAPFSPSALRAARVTTSTSSSSSSLSTTATGATTATTSGARDELDQDQGNKKMNPTKFARGRSASIAACAKQQQQQQQQQQLQKPLPLQEQKQQQQRHGKPMHEPRQHSRHLSTDIKAKDKPKRRGTVGEQQQQQSQRVRRTAQTEKSSSLVIQGQQQQQQNEQCMQQDAPVHVHSCQESASTTTADTFSKDSCPQETEDEAPQEKAEPTPFVQVTISITPADDPTPPLCSPPPVETSPALIRRFLVKEVAAAASAPNTIATAQPSMPKTTVALSSFETATLTQECASTAAARGTGCDRDSVDASGVLQQDECPTTTLPSVVGSDPLWASMTTRPLIAPSSSPQLSAAQIMVSRIVEKNKRRRSLGDLVNIMSKKTRDYIPHARTSTNSGSGAHHHQQDTTAVDNKSAGRRSISEAPCSPTHVSTLESFPKHSSTSSLRIQYLKDFFRSGPSTAAHARSASAAEVPIGRENGRPDHGHGSEERTAVMDTTGQAPSDIPATDGPHHPISESATSSRRSSFMALLPGISRKPPRLWVTTAATSGQDSNPGTPLSRSTRQHPSEDGSQFSSSSRTHSNTSSACPSPVLDRIHVDQPCTSNADFDATRFPDQMLTLPRPVFCLAQRGQDSAGRSDRPSPLPSLTSVNAIWKDQLVQGNYIQDESYPSQEPNNSNSNGNSIRSSSSSNGSSRGANINIPHNASEHDHDHDQQASSAGTLETTGRWPWAQLDKDKWNTTFLSAHRGLLLLPPTYSPADEMGDPLAAYHPTDRPQSVLGLGGSSLEEGNCLHLRFGGAATSLESTSLAGTGGMSTSVYFDDALGQSSYSNGLYGSPIHTKQQPAGFV